MSSPAAPPGQMVDLGGFRLHAVVCGAGSPTVILEPALGGFALQYAHIQSAVSAFTRVLSYDRAGQGWSDPSPHPRTPAHLAAELRALLDRLGIEPPYVLAGHSFGGLVSRVYAGLHPQDVAGVVLIDSPHVDEYAAFGSVDDFVRRAAAGVRIMKIAARLGLARPVAKLSLGSAAQTLSKEDLDRFLTVISRPSHHEATLAEFTQHRHYFGPQSEVPPTLGDIPLAVVTAGNSTAGRGKIGSLTAEQVNEQHQRLQQDLLRLSPRSEQVLVPGAAHLSLLLEPQYAAQVAAAIQRMVAGGRSKDHPREHGEGTEGTEKEL